MKSTNTFWALLAGLGLGATAVIAYLSGGTAQPMKAASNDRYQDYVMATGAVNISPRIQTDGVWLLDYKSGKLLGTVIDRTAGKIIGWAEVDLVAEFELTPKQDVHFMMTTGHITSSQSALYLAETTTGKFGVYTMGPGPNNSGVGIRRHDLSSFRKPMNVVAPAAGLPPEIPVPLPNGFPQPLPSPAVPAQIPLPLPPK